jgi:hypothetical protein
MAQQLDSEPGRFWPAILAAWAWAQRHGICCCCHSFWAALSDSDEPEPELEVIEDSSIAIASVASAEAKSEAEAVPSTLKPTSVITVEVEEVRAPSPAYEPAPPAATTAQSPSSGLRQTL